MSDIIEKLGETVSIQGSILNILKAMQENQAELIKRVVTLEKEVIKLKKQNLWEKKQK